MKRATLLPKLVVAAICATAPGVPLAVGAETGPTAEADVILPDCPAAALDARALLAALTLELDHDGVRHINLVASQRPDGVATIEVTLDCEPGANQVRLRARNAPYQEAHRAMDIADLPRRLRARAVALAAAELARSTWSSLPRPAEVEDSPPVDADTAESAEPSPPFPAASKPPPPRPAVEPPAAKLPHAAQQRRWLGLAAGPATRWFLPAANPAFGGRVAARIGRWR